jgi:hypothetical protein
MKAAKRRRGHCELLKELPKMEVWRDAGVELVSILAEHRIDAHLPFGTYFVPELSG